MSISHHSVVTADDLVLTLPDGRRLFGPLQLACARERTGLVGDNGSGKTLLLETLVGLRTPSSGTLVRNGRLAYVPQQPGRGPSPLRPRDPTRASGGSPTVAERLGIAGRLAALRRIEAGSIDEEDFRLVGPDGWELEARARVVLQRFDLGWVALDRPVSSLSGGERARVSLAGAFMDDPDLLVLDEPTNDIDRAGREGLLSSLEEFRGGLLVVSHDRTLLDGVDRILELSGGDLREYGGNYTLYRELRRREREAADAELESAQAALNRARRNRQEVRERQEQRRARGRRSRKGSGTPKILLNARRNTAEGTSARLGRVQDDAVERSAARLARATERSLEMEELRIDMRSSEVPATKRILEIVELDFRYPDAESPVLTNFSWTIRGPRRWAITGPNGVGKSTLLHLLTGRLTPSSGTVEVGIPPHGVAYLDQRQSLLGEDRTVLEAFRESWPDWSEPRARHVLARFLFPGEAALADVDTLSGGERMRAALACVLGGPRSPGLLLLDEPTNHLDLRSLETLEAAAQEFDGALVAVSHDIAFLEALGIERWLEMERPASTAESSRPGSHG